MPPTSDHHNPNRIGDATRGASVPSRRAPERLPNADEAFVTGVFDAVQAALDVGDIGASLALLEALPNETDIREYGATHTELSAGIQALIPYERFTAPEFFAAARNRGMTPYQWAGVEALRLQGVRSYVVDSLVPEGERGLCAPSGLAIRTNATFHVLPDYLHVYEELAIHSCPLLVSLPKGVFVEGDFRSSQSAIAMIPGDCVITGDVKIEESDLFEGFEKGISFGGNVLVQACRSFSRIPDDCTVPKMLFIDEFCPSFSHVPKNLHVGESFCLPINNNPWTIDGLPDDLRVGGTLTNCPPHLEERAKLLLAAGKIGAIEYLIKRRVT